MSMGEQVLPASMGLLARLEDRARHVARQLGHDLGPLRMGRLGEHVADCRRCGGLAIITPAHGMGVRGTACSVQCLTRRRLRPLPSIHSVGTDR
jgi:hypothetical protein